MGSSKILETITKINPNAVVTEEETILKLVL